MWSARIFDLQSGEPKADVAVSADSAFGQGDQTDRSARIQLHAGYDRDGWQDIIARWYDRSLVFLWNGRAVSESLIIDAPRYNRRSDMLTVTHVPVPILLSRRWMHGVGTSEGTGGYDPRGYFSVAGVSVAGAVVQVLERAYCAPISAAWPIPVQLPAIEGGMFEQTWPFHQFQNAAAMIRDLTNRDDGPEMDLRPVIGADGRLTRVQRVGQLTGPHFDIYLDAADSAAETANYGLFGRDTTTGVHFPGNGEDEDMKVGAAFLPESAGLARDSIDWNKNEANVQRLSKQAQGFLDARAGAAQRWSLTVKTRRLDPSTVRVGSTVTIFSDNKRWEPPVSNARVLGFSGTCGETYTLELQDV